MTNAETPTVAEPRAGTLAACRHCRMSIIYDAEQRIGWTHVMSRKIACDNLPPVGWGRSNV